MPPPGAIIKDPLAPIGGAGAPPPGVQLYDPGTPLSEDSNQIVRDYISNHPDPRSAEARVNSTAYVAAMTGTNPKFILDNYDAFMSQWTNGASDPLSAWGAVQRHWEIASIQTEIGTLQHQAKWGLLDAAEATERIDELRASMPSPDEMRRGLPITILKAAAEVLPHMAGALRRPPVAPELEALRDVPSFGIVSGFLGLTAGIHAQRIIREQRDQNDSPWSPYVSSIPMAYATSFAAGMGAGMLANAKRVEEGLAYDEMLAEGIDRTTAHWVSFGVGAANAAVEVVQVGTLAGVVTGPLVQAARRGIQKAVGTRALNTLAVRLGTRLSGQAVEQYAEEAIQESNAIVGAFIAREIDRNVNGTTITQEQADEAKTLIGRAIMDYTSNLGRIHEAGRTAALASTILGLPGGLKGVVGDVRRARGAMEVPEQTAPTAPLVEDETPVPERVEQLQTRVVELEQEIGEGSATPETLAEYLRAQYMLDDLEVANTEETEQVRGQVWQKTRAEYVREAAEAAPINVDAPDLRAAVGAALPGVSEQEVDAHIILLEMAAQAGGINVEENVSVATPEQASQMLAESPGSPAAVQLTEDRKALLAFSKNADLGSLSHELGHIIRHWLPEDLQQRANEWAGVEVGAAWDVASEEAFTEAFTSWLRNGQAPTVQLESVFQRIAEWMKRIVETVTQRWELDSRITSVFEELYADRRSPLQATPTVAEANTLFQPRRAFHGSPTVFDRFDIDFIGTGEGAQAYGHGLYFTSEREIAEYYRDTLSAIPAGYELNGEPVMGLLDAMYDSGDQRAEVLEAVLLHRTPAAIRESFAGDERADVAEYAQTITTEALTPLDENGDPIDHADVYGSIAEVEIADGRWLDYEEAISAEDLARVNAIPGVEIPAAVLDTFDNPEDVPARVPTAGGAAVTHRITPKGNHEFFLEPADSPGAGFRLSFEDVIRTIGAEASGGRVYGAVSEQLGGDRQASEALQEAGFIGLQYASGEGDATNYVVFDDSAIQITSRTLFQPPTPPETKAALLERYGEATKSLDAGFILSDGTAIDLARTTERSVYHQTVATELGVPDLEKFMAENGLLRVDMIGHYVQSAGQPTDAQLAWLEENFPTGGLNVEVTGPEGATRRDLRFAENAAELEEAFRKRPLFQPAPRVGTTEWEQWVGERRVAWEAGASADADDLRLLRSKLVEERGLATKHEEIAEASAEAAAEFSDPEGWNRRRFVEIATEMGLEQPFNPQDAEVYDAAADAGLTVLRGLFGVFDTIEDTWRAHADKFNERAIRLGEQAEQHRAKADSLEAAIEKAESGQPQFETGEPVIVRAWHGTATPGFDDFDRGKLGGNTGAGSAKLGFFFAGRRETSEAYLDLKFDGFPSISSFPWRGYTTAAPGVRWSFSRFLSQELGNEIGRPRSGYDELVNEIALEALGRERVEEIIAEVVWPAVRSEAEHGRLDPTMNEEAIQDTWGDPLPEEFDFTLAGNMYEVAVRFDNPMVHDYDGERYREETYRSVIERAIKEGHDGVILKNTYDGGPIDNIFVALENEQIGIIEAHREGMLFQPDPHRDAVANAVVSGEYVPANVLDEYRGEEWADAEIERREQLRSEIGHFDDANEFVAFHLTMDPEPGTEEYYRNVYDDGAREVVPRAEADRRFLETLNDKEVLAGWLAAVAENSSPGSVPHELVYLAGRSVLKGSKISDGLQKRVIDQINKDPTGWRTLFAEAAQDQDILLQIQAEEELLSVDEKEIAQLREANRVLREQNRRNAENVSQHERAIRSHQTWLAGQERLVRELRGELSDLREEQADFVRSARAEARAGDREARERRIREIAENVREVKAEIRDRAKAKEYHEKLIRRIMRDPAASVDVEQATQILEMQARYEVTISPRVRQAREMLRGLLDIETDPERRAAFEAEVNLRSLKDMSIDELETLDGEIEALRKEGRAKRMQFEIQQKIEIAELVTQVSVEVNDAEVPEDVANRGTRDTEGKRRRPVRSRYDQTLHMNRLADMLGPTSVELLDTLVNDQTDDKLRKVDGRMDRWNAAMEKLKIRASELTDPFRPGITFQEAVGVWIADQNADSAMAIRYGNNISEQTIADINRNLPAKWKDYGEALLDLFSDDDFGRMQEVYVRATNSRMVRVDRYFPMRRADIVPKSASEDVLNDLAGRSSGLRGRPNRGFTHRRQNISEEHQTPIRVDSTNIALQGIEAQEHYTEFNDLIRKLDRVYRNKDVRESITQKYGSELVDVIDRYINNIANPGGMVAMTSMDRTLRQLRANFQVSALVGNIVSVGVNAPGVLLYLPWSGPLRIVGAIGKAMRNPAEFVRFVDDRAPQVKHRTIDPLVTQLKNLSQIEAPSTPAGRAWKASVLQMGQLGLAPLQLMDKLTVYIGWRAAYDYAIDVKDMSEADAIKYARDATNSTQPSGDPKDLPDIYNSEAARWFLMFQAPLNQIWNMLTYDMTTGRGTKMNKIAAATWTLASLVMTGFVINMVREKRFLPEDLEEFALVATSQFVESIPFVGGDIQAALDKEWYAGRGVSMLPVAVTAAQSLMTLADAEASSDKKVRAAVRLAGAAGRTVGAPSVAATRAFRALVDDQQLEFRVDLWELIGGPPEVKE